jgi:NAD(P)-dependent dehydrogenase (short-subunit alcohol dehydrogenase family)
MDKALMNIVTGKAKLAVVTGAAGGMGAAIAKKLASAGWPLLLCDLDTARLAPIAQACRAAAGSVETLAVEILAGDIDDAAYPAKLDAALASREIGAFIHTAGLSPTMADGPRILRVNFDATARLVDVVRPRMCAGGCAVLIASTAAHMLKSAELDRAQKEAVTARHSAPLLPWAERPEMAYPASKGAVIALVAHEAAAFAERGARIMSISPGFIDTAMARAEQAVSEKMNMMLARTPLKRFGTVEEIADVALFLCSEEASYVTGSDIRVDGGILGELGF